MILNHSSRAESWLFWALTQLGKVSFFPGWYEVLGGAMAVVVGDVLAQPAPEGLDRHEVGAVAGQGYEFDLQRGRGFAHRLGAVIGRAVPHPYERLVRPF